LSQCLSNRLAAVNDQFRMIARLRLAKVPLCLLIGSATLFGAILADPVISSPTLFVVVGVFFVATGAATLNSLQEQHLDGKMERTKARPLPAGQLTPRQACCQALILILGGFFLLFMKTAALQSVVMTTTAIVLYNGIYTPLKKITVLAIIPGAICGAMPAYIGWLAGGGEALGFTAILLFALFVLWQIPHFWLILLNFQEDYSAGRLPNLLNMFREITLKRLFFTWIGALAFIMLMFATLEYPLANAVRYGIVINAFCLPGIFFSWLKLCKSDDYRVLFVALNCALFVHMAILAVGRVIGHQ
jgi:heme o synthase